MFLNPLFASFASFLLAMVYARVTSRNISVIECEVKVKDKLRKQTAKGGEACGREQLK
jgi:hypothetical protein